MLTIIKYTILENIRSKIYISAIGLIFLILGISWLGSTINQNFGELYLSIFAFGMNLTEILILAIALFLPTNHLSLEFEKGTAHVLWAKLKNRSIYYIGKYYAFLSIIISIVLIASFFIGVLVVLTGAEIKHVLFLKYFIFAQLMQVACILSIVFLLYSFLRNSLVSSLLSLLILYFTIFLGTAKSIFHTSDNIILKIIYGAMYYSMPHLSYYNVENQVIYMEDISMTYLFVVFLYTLFFSSVVMYLANIVFSKKEG